MPKRIKKRRPGPWPPPPPPPPAPYTTISIQPSNGSTGVSPTTEVLCIGSAPTGVVYRPKTLQVGINSLFVYDGKDGFSAPDFTGEISFTPDNKLFQLRIVPRRAFLYRVKVSVELIVGVTIAGHNYTDVFSSLFEIRPSSESIELTTFARLYASETPWPDYGALAALRARLRPMLEGTIPGSYYPHALYRIYRSQLWPMVKLIPGLGNVSQPLNTIQGDDLAFHGSLDALITTATLLWQPCLGTLKQLGISTALLDILNNGFEAPNTREQLAAICAVVVLTTTLVQQKLANPSFSPIQYPGLL